VGADGLSCQSVSAGSDTRSAVNGISLQEPDLRNTMDDTTIAAVAVLAMISVQLLYAAGNRKLAEMRQRHEKDLSRVHEQLQAIAAGQASVAERFDRLEARMQRLGHKVAVLTSSCDNEAGATASSRTAPTASSPTSPTTKQPDRPREHRRKLHRTSLEFSSSLPTQDRTNIIASPEHPLTPLPRTSPRAMRTSARAMNPKPMSSGSRMTLAY